LQAKNDMALNGSESGPTALLMVLAVLDHGKIDSPFVHLLLRRLNSQTIFYLLVYSKTIYFCACTEKIDVIKQSCGINHQPKGFVIMTNRQIIHQNSANRQGHTMAQTVFFHIAMAALAGLTPFAIAFIIVLA
jgi:hypothetical protein